MARAVKHYDVQAIQTYTKKSPHIVDLDLCAPGMHHQHFSPWKLHMKHLHEACRTTLSSAPPWPSLTAMTWGEWEIARKSSHLSFSFWMLLLQVKLWDWAWSHLVQVYLGESMVVCTISILDLKVVIFLLSCHHCSLHLQWRSLEELWIAKSWKDILNFLETHFFPMYMCMT